MSSTSDRRRPSITVVGLGPAGPDLLTTQTTEAIQRIPHRFGRTNRHDAASALGEATFFDSVYDSAANMDAVYDTICNGVVAAAHLHGEVLYAVPGSPRVAELTVELLSAREDAEVNVLPALSFIDLAWVRLGVDPITAGVRIIDGHEFATAAAGERGPLLVCQCDRGSVMSDMKLSLDEWPTTPVTVLSALGHSTERLYEIPFSELDRVPADHLTSVYIPELASPVARQLVSFWEVVRELREQCPWDREQTNESLKSYLLEETYELLEAIDHFDPADGAGADDLEEELGDVLFQVYFHSVIASELGWFDLADVAAKVETKLRTRHPHVFAGTDPDVDLGRQWESIKADEKRRTSVLDGIPEAMPALAWSQKLVRRARRIDTAPDSAADGSLAVPSAPAGELTATSIGSWLFAVASAAADAGIDAEDALRSEARRFAERVRRVESH